MQMMMKLISGPAISSVTSFTSVVKKQFDGFWTGKLESEIWNLEFSISHLASSKIAAHVSTPSN